MATGSTDYRSKEGGNMLSRVRFYYSSTYYASGNYSKVTITPQLWTQGNLGTSTFYFIGDAAYSQSGVYLNGDLLHQIDNGYGSGYVYLTTYSNPYQDYVGMFEQNDDWGPITLYHDSSGNASATLGLRGVAICMADTSLKAIFSFTNHFPFSIHEDEPYSVTYNANGGTGAPSALPVYYNVTYTLSSTEPSKANSSATPYTVTYKINYTGGTDPTAGSAARTTSYTFSKWNTKSDGTGTDYNSGASITPTGNVALYAKYTSSTTTAAVTLPTPTRTGYTFNGWYTASSGGTKVGNGGASYTPTGNVTLYAHWTLKTYTLSISQGSGSTITVTRGGTPLNNGATISHFDVLAISISANTGYNIGTHTVNGSNWTSGNYTVSGATSVVSTATKKTFKLTITQGSKSTATVNRTESPIGGASTGSLSTNATLYYNDKLKVTFSASGGYHITTHTVNGSTFTSGNTHTATAAVTVVSAAAANTYTVKFNANRGTASGSGTMSNQSYTYDTAQNLRANTFTRYYTVSFDGNGITNPASKNANSTFNGWATSESGSKAYDDGQSVKNLTTTNNGTVNLYAVWTNGSVTLPTPTRAGYTFNGWYTAATGGTKIGNGGASYTPTAGITLHAQWTRINYKLTLTKSDTGVTVSVTRNGTALANNATIYYGDSLTVTYTVTAGYEILTHTINGSNFTSPATVSVTGNTEVVVTVKTSAHMYIGDGTNWAAYQIYIGNGSGWDLYQAYIGDGTNWVAY